MKVSLHLAVLLGALALSNSVARADGNRIAFQRVFPIWMKNALPGGAKSLFRGAFSLAAKQSWNLQLFRYGGDNCGTENTLCALHLQLFQRDARGVGHLKRTLRFHFQNADEPQQFGARLRWLDRKQTQPILQIDAFDKAENGIIGDHIFATFSDAKTQFLGAAGVQRVQFGRWIFGDSSGQTLDFSRDSNGQLQFKATVLSTGELPPTVWNATWDGTQWQALKAPDIYVNSFLLISPPLQF